MDNEPEHNPVGNEHPLRGMIYGLVTIGIFALAIAGCCGVFG